MSLVTNLRQVLTGARSIVGRLGFRLHTVAIVNNFALGQHTGDVDLSDVTPITEQGFSPRCVWLSDSQIALSGLGSGAVEIGPITPGFTDLDLLRGTVLDVGDTLHILITGPKHPTGALYRLTALRADKALRYLLRAVPVSA